MTTARHGLTRDALTADQQAFVVAVARFVEDLRKGGRFHKELCVESSRLHTTVDDDSLSDLGDTLARLSGFPSQPLLDALQPSTVDAIHDALSDLDRSDLEAAYQELAAAYR